VLGDVQTIGHLVDGIFDIKDPFLVEIQHDLTILALLETLRSAFTSSIVNSSVCVTRSSTEEAKLTEEPTPAFLAE
jgi:hypothetical protein